MQQIEEAQERDSRQPHEVAQLIKFRTTHQRHSGTSLSVPQRNNPWLCCSVHFRLMIMDDGAGPPMPRELCVATPALDVSIFLCFACMCMCMCMRPAEGLGGGGAAPHVASQRFPCVVFFCLEPSDCAYMYIKYKVHLHKTPPST